MESSEETGKYPGSAGLSTDDTSGGVARSAGIVSAATLPSRILGLVRDVTLANVFSAAATDAFFIAFMIPNLFRRLVGEGSLTVAFVPVFTGWLQRSHEEARRVFDATWTLGALVGLALAGGGIAFADPLIHLFAPGFSLEPGKHELAVLLLRWCFSYLFFLILVAVAMGALNSMGHFLAPAIAPVLLNLCLIAAAFGSAWFDPPILALGVAVVVAGALQVLAQLPPLRRRSLWPRPLFAPRHPAVRRLGQLMAPAVLGASVFQLNILVSRFLSSFLGDGGVSYLYYADRLLELPLGLFVVALGTASLPSFSRLVKSEDRAGLGAAFSGTLGLVLSLALPSTVGLLLLREEIFAALFAWNADTFSTGAIGGCARALAFYAIGLVPIAVSRICVGVCVAHEDTRTPARAAGLSLLVNAAASLILIGPLPDRGLGGGLPGALVELQHRVALFDLGFAGLALAASFAAAANATYLLFVVRRHAPTLGRADLGGAGRLALAACGMAIAVEAARRAAPLPPPGSIAAVAVLSVYVVVGVGVYAALLWLLRAPEIAALRRIAARSR